MGGHNNSQMETVDYFRLNDILVKLVNDKKILPTERNSLLKKSGLFMITENKWLQEKAGILTFYSNFIDEYDNYNSDQAI